MAFNYDAARATAKRLIELFGQAGSAIKEAVPAGPDIYGAIVAAQDEVVISGTVTPKLDYTQAEIDGESVKIGDSYVLFHSEAAPQIDMTITINSVKSRIVSISPLDSVDGINIFRKLQLRGGA